MRAAPDPGSTDCPPTFPPPPTCPQDNYTVSQPCLTALLDRAADINATMLLLPDGLEGKVALLQQAQVS